MKMNCIIVDDEPVARKLLQEYLEDIDYLEVKGIAENPLKANAILGSESIDLMFLDVDMPKISGIEYLRTLSNLPMVIMTTAYAEYATDGFELDVVDYLVKPFSFERFLKACNKAKDFYELKKGQGPGGEPPANHFFVKCDNKIEKIFYDDLIAVEAMLNYVVLHTNQGKKIAYLTIKGILEQLPPELFLKVHKSSVINIAKVRSIEGNELNLGQLKIVVSQNFYERTMKVIIKDRMIKR